MARKVDFTEVLQRMSATHDAYDRAAIAAAQEAVMNHEGHIEVDEITITSRGDDEQGCYVLAWLWVDADIINTSKEQ